MSFESTPSFLFGNDLYSPTRTIKQLIDENGTGMQAFGTQSLWIGTNKEFTPPREGNTVIPYTAGADYFTRLAGAMADAQREIWIAGWQVNWDLDMVPGNRLFDVLLSAAQIHQNLQIYVMPWAGSSEMPTYAKETREALYLINDIVGRQAVHVKLAPELADESPIFMSHHQKHVIIDREIAFVGGIDLAYGRRDDATYDLHADAKDRPRRSLERYNGCVAHIAHEEASTVIDPAQLATERAQVEYAAVEAGRYDPAAMPHPVKDAILKKIQQSGIKQASTSFKGLTLDPTRQPRMPWQDSHVEIQGPAALDIALNFAARWNCITGTGEPKLTLPSPGASIKGKGTCMVQVLRSASSNMCKTEYANMNSAQKTQYFGSSTPIAQVEDNICQAMVNLIEQSNYYIYIENQFFVSGFGKQQGYAPGSKSGPMRAVEQANSYIENRIPYLTHAVQGDGNAPPHNPICHALGERIGKAIQHDASFHVTIVLPVHPEGMLCDSVVMSQVHQTMQTLVFGEFSLINQVRRHLKVRQLRHLNDPDPNRGYLGDAYLDIPIEDCESYLTLLNLRNYAKLETTTPDGKKEERYVTEQIYVHNKMMIVDDAYAIVGSANINERSMLGTRDSELSALVVDTATEQNDITGDCKFVYTRKFARDLRQKVWKKIFGFTAGGNRTASTLEFALDQPANPNAWAEIRKVAMKNTKSFEAAFDFIPRNMNIQQTDNASIWPTFDRNKSAKPQELKDVRMPFNKTFWDKAQHNPAAKNLDSNVKGFITLLPLEWTTGEFNKFDYHSALISKIEPKQEVPAGTGQSQQIEMAETENSGPEAS
jgi:phospholipase D1/2